MALSREKFLGLKAVSWSRLWAQRAQYPLIEEYGLNYTGLHTLIKEYGSNYKGLHTLIK